MDGNLQKPRLICFVDNLESEFVSRVLRAMEQVTDAAGWKLHPCGLEALLWDDCNALLHEEAHSGENSAAAFVHFELNIDRAAFFKSAKIPLGCMGGTMKDVECVLDDSIEGGFLGGDFLCDLGHRRIGMISGDPKIPEFKARETGFKSALLEADIRLDRELIQVADPALPEQGKNAALALLKLQSPPTAIFCSAGDAAAEGVYAAAQSLGLRIPGDLSVLGYDDLPSTESMQPPLSTLRQPLESMGKQLAEQLMAAAARSPRRSSVKTIVIPSLVRRLSCAPPKSR